MIRKLFHRHSMSTFVIPANEVFGIKLIHAISLAENTHHHFELKPCPEHGLLRMEKTGKCKAWDCSINYRIIPYPNLSEVLVTYKKCLTCDYYTIKVQCGIYKYVVNGEYIKLKLDELKAKKDDAETERLLNLGNPDYKSNIDYEEKIKKYEQIIQEQQNSLNKLRKYARIKLEQLNISRQNDAIWANIPEKVKKDLIKKYGKDIQPPEIETLEIS